jgi:hypothetical protein
MTDNKDWWKTAGAEFGLTPEEAEAHRQAWEDLRRLHVGPFCIETVKDLHAALTQAQGGAPVDAETWRRLDARSTIIAEMAAAAEHDILESFLKTYNGPVQ